MKWLFPLLLTMSCAGSVTAAEPDLLSLVLARLAEPAVVRADFVQEKTLRVLSRPIVSRGRIIVSRGEGLIWQIEAPLEMSIAFSDARIVESDADGRHLVDGGGDNRIQTEVGRVFRGLLTPDPEILQRYFRLNVEGDVDNWRIDLTPRSAGLATFIEALQIVGGRTIETIVIRESDTDSTVIRLENVAVAGSLTEDERALLSMP
ncbi:MAG: outer membrane lipoprotein carrier protein LolA [Thiogranum sp.]|nr:outer membrane lipoprotein carrier protein LolA [Thiogranum sp.]